MSERLHRELIADRAIIHERPPIAHKVDRCFEVPKAFYAATVGLYLGFLAILGFGLSSPELGIPMAIFVLFVVSGFGVPMIWTKLAPDSGVKPMGMGDLKRLGLSTYSGKLTSRDVALQMLILPILIVCWAMAIIAIVATV
jgi:hypothetical protein